MSTRTVGTPLVYCTGTPRFGKVISFFLILRKFVPVDGYAFPYESRARRHVGAWIRQGYGSETTKGVSVTAENDANLT